MTEAWSDLLIDMGVKFQLYSYFYMRDTLRRKGAKARELLARMDKAKAKGYRFMLDSGAFTYQVKATLAPDSLPTPFEYFQEYKRFCADYGYLFENIAELDIDETVKDPFTGEVISTAQVDEWTNEFFSIPHLAHKIMPVYHRWRGKRWLEDWLLDTRSPFVGIASAVVDGLGAVISRCHRYGKFVHGFGFTRMKTDLKYTHFDSVDSSTWLRADKFGGTMIFQNGRLHILDHLHKRERARFRTWYRSWGLDFKKIMADDLAENRLATIITWREMQNFYEQHWRFMKNGKLPYLYEMTRDGTLPDRHPLDDRPEPGQPALTVFR